MTTPVNILGFSFSLPAPYTEGHRCTLAEADVLNRSLARSLAKGLHRIISTKPDSTERIEIERSARAFITEFINGFANGHEALRAIEIEARRIALSALEAQLYKQGKKLSDLAKAEVEEHIVALVATSGVRDEAARRVNALQHVARSARSDLDAVLLVERETESA